VLNIVLLTPEDANEYQRLRLGGLLESPLGFRSSHNDEAGRTLSEVMERLTSAADGGACVFGGRLDGHLVGTLAFNRPRRQKVGHAAELTGMYVAPAYRRRGFGGALLGAAISHARAMSGIRYLRLTVNASNVAARSLYRSRGFECVGVEPEAIFVDGRYHDEELMVLRLRPNTEPEPVNHANHR
jgi:ribosomal protein S18 acetylase RimI-like enzyme